MLAKKIKIANIKRQREFIESQLEKLSLTNTDGDTSYPYVGYIFPEVKSHFDAEGFKIVEFNNEALLALTKGRTIYLFTIKDDIVLTDEESEEAEKVKTVNESIDDMLNEAFKDCPDISGIFGDDEIDYGNSSAADFFAFLKKLSNSDESVNPDSEPKDIDDGYEDEP